MESDYKQKIENIFKIKIKDDDLFRLALTHTSYSSEIGNDLNYERLEFLGDAVLKLCVSDILYKKYPEYKEGNLSKIRSIVVSDRALSKLVDKFGLEEFIILGKQEEKMGGRSKESIKACMLEALFGACYLSGEFKKVRVFLEYSLSDLIEEVDNNFYKYNSKEVLQEYTQGLTHEQPKYILKKEEGPAHDKTFTIEVLYRGEIISEGKGKTKRDAEKDAAYKACIKMDIIKG